MNKDQVRKTITPLNAQYFLDNLEKSDGKDFRTEKEKQMIDGERFSFPVVENRTGIIEWNYDHNEFHAFSIPTNVLDTVCKTNRGFGFESLTGW
jgi:hypothetical protein